MATNNNILNTNPNHRVFIVIGIILLLTATNVISYNVGKRARFEEFLVVPHTPIAMASPTPISTPKVIVPPPNPTVYTSKKLGLSFSYLADPGGQHVAVKEIGNKIHVYVDRNGSVPNEDYEGGKSVEILSKSANDTLEQALLKRYINKPTGKNCEITKPGLKREYYPQNNTYTIAGVGVKSSISQDDIAKIILEMEKCLQTDDGVFGVYFLSDSKHPDKLLKFILGQDSLPSGITSPDIGRGGYDWDETIRLLD